ncbi:SLC13 family permease [Legionella micdadei]|uniref:Putative arsenite efflux membrane component-like protein n=1 Tax=Legionella micdadei TaxID=451 RepID=A0A098GII0_LEGMI|nr:SLC13 family permease [Legionella micdadei]ARG97261.1 anion transporter [Legionella micdadei]ARH00434.1 anion transporter [Legionella micdadei]KTD28137.1 arsenite efflux membrane component-like protein [Legionella micdadei]NSL16767.1 anion transporter [Legionella micdadei]CEG61281.1 putative arsenite efflux membrane component-like protein [Legionella micdadei]
MPIAVVILLIVLFAIAFRRVIRVAIPIWVIMAIGAVAALLLQQITGLSALKAIEPEVMFYLFGVFLICQAAEDCGYLEHLTDKIFRRARTGKQALAIIVFILGLSAALLMNDTIAIIGTPILLQLCKSHRGLIKPLLFGLAFSITVGSTLSPIGNPQNLLIAVKGEIVSPFFDFVYSLLIPTLLSLVVTYLLIYFKFKTMLNEPIEKPIPLPINNYQVVILVKISLAIMVVLVGAKIIMDCIQTVVRINFSYIALIAALPLLLSKQRWNFIKKLDWGTLIFFASTFVLMQAVWESGFFQANINHFHITVTQIPVVLAISTILSQFISNVPLVALYLPLLLHHHLPHSHLLALAVGSTLAGNLSILGAASNIIIIQNSEKRGVRGFGFLEFIKLGLPLTLITILIFAYFL